MDDFPAGPRTFVTLYDLSRPQRSFLARFRMALPISNFDRDGWRSLLNAPPAIMVERFETHGLLRPASVAEALSAALGSEQLKALAKDRGLRSSGTKDELADRLSAADLDGMDALTSATKRWICTERGRAIAVEHVAQEEIESEEALKSSFDQLAARDFPAAARTMGQYEANQLFPRGIGIDWRSYDPTADVERLEIMFGESPGILAGVPDRVLAQLRVAAGMKLLWGRSRVGRWFPEKTVAGSHLGPDAAARMLVFFARNRRLILAGGPGSGNPVLVEVVGVKDSRACEACRELSGTRYPISEAPEVPLSHCSSEMGCRCHYRFSRGTLWSG